MNRVFYDIETEEYVTEAELREEFELLQEENPSEYGYMTFEGYVENCLEGTLEKVGF